MQWYVLRSNKGGKERVQLYMLGGGEDFKKNGLGEFYWKGDVIKIRKDGLQERKFSLVGDI